MYHDATAYDRLNSLPLWRQMGSITLDEMSGIRLMNRVDTKYVLTDDESIRLMEMAAERGYSVQIIDGIRACRYDTLYYDTDEREMYLRHHNRMLTRQKIRTRQYIESGITFLEIKNKTNTGRTRKKRMEIDRMSFGGFDSDSAAAAFCLSKSDYAAEELTPALSTRFNRITLVNPARSERLTIDTDLRFGNPRETTEARIDGLVIVELKQDASQPSPMKEMMNIMRIKPLSVSKYCIGTVLTAPEVKSNRFKQKLRRIDKRLRGYTTE